ncbi:MAG: caspase family protein [Bacteroidales bacterium]|nr:caspase family protein [Bacteroidales bacterium]
MKKLLCAIICIMSLSAIAQDKALLIGVSTYQDGSGWGKIHSYNDINLLRESLPETCAITTLCDSDATYQGIITAVKQLIKNSCIGDQVLLHFSGHGQQMISSDPNESDLLDEALIPYDAPRIRSNTYNGEKHLVDNEIEGLVNELRSSVGSKGLVVVTVDACHSGDSHRGGESDEEEVFVRGTPEIFGLNTISKDSMYTIYQHQDKVDYVSLCSKDSVADVVYISACMPYDTSTEVKDNGVSYGPLSYSMANAYGVFDFDSIKEWTQSIDSYMRITIKQKPYIVSTLE